MNSRKAMPRPKIPDPPTTLLEARRLGARKAWADLMGTQEVWNDCFSAVTWRKTLPQAWQEEVERVIVYVYHNEKDPPGLED